ESLRQAAPDLAYLTAGALNLKGKEAREPIHILVGDAALAASEAFAALASAHAKAVAALGTEGEAAAIAVCVRPAAEIEPGLEKFYARLPERREDYPAAAEAVPA